MNGLITYKVDRKESRTDIMGLAEVAFQFSENTYVGNKILVFPINIKSENHHL